MGINAHGASKRAPAAPLARRGERPLEVTVSRCSRLADREERKTTQTPAAGCSKVYTSVCCSPVRASLSPFSRSDSGAFLFLFFFSPYSWKDSCFQQLQLFHVSCLLVIFISNKHSSKPLHLALGMLLPFILPEKVTGVSGLKKK